MVRYLKICSFCIDKIILLFGRPGSITRPDTHWFVPVNFLIHAVRNLIKILSDRFENNFKSYGIFVNDIHTTFFFTHLKTAFEA